MAWGLALAAGARLVDAKEGSFWHAATGGTNYYGHGDGYGVSCDDACKIAAAGECDAKGFVELDSLENFNLAKPDAMICSESSSRSLHLLSSQVPSPNPVLHLLLLLLLLLHLVTLMSPPCSCTLPAQQAPSCPSGFLESV